MPIQPRPEQRFVAMKNKKVTMRQRSKPDKSNVTYLQKNNGQDNEPTIDIRRANNYPTRPRTFFI